MILVNAGGGRTSRIGEHWEESSCRALVHATLVRLEREHRALEQDWARIAESLQRFADGEADALDDEAAMCLLAAYVAHAEFEEAVVLPLAARLLGPRRSEALGWSMAKRHALGRAFGYR